jgi:hypothetical protein
MDLVSSWLAGMSLRDVVSPATAIIGSIAGAWWGARLRMQSQLADERKELARWQESQRNQKISFLRSLHVEMTILWRRYYDLLGHEVESFVPEDIRRVNHSFSQDYFTVYHSSAAMLGLIDNSDVPVIVVDTYLQAKAVIDIVQVISSENREIERLEEDMNSAGAGGTSSYFAQRIAAIRGRTAARFRKMSGEHEKFKRLVSIFDQLMKDEIERLTHPHGM